MEQNETVSTLLEESRALERTGNVTRDVFITGQNGHTNSSYCVATDRVNHPEAASAAEDTETKVDGFIFLH
jgi:hypothetical protein